MYNMGIEETDMSIEEIADIEAEESRQNLEYEYNILKGENDSLKFRLAVIEHIASDLKSDLEEVISYYDITNLEQ